jgi:hypothetical protein
VDLVSAPGRGYDDLTSPDDLVQTITREQWLRNQRDQSEDDDGKRVVESVGYTGTKLA